MLFVQLYIKVNILSN